MIEKKTASYPTPAQCLGRGVKFVAHGLWLKLSAFIWPSTGRPFKSPGLPLAKAFVELLGGSLELESKEGAGTTATVSFPRAASRGRRCGPSRPTEPPVLQAGMD